MQYVSLKLTDRDDDEVGEVRLKMSTLMGSGKALNTILPSNLSSKQQLLVLKESRSNWYPMFNTATNESPGQLQISTEFIPDESWE